MSDLFRTIACSDERKRKTYLQELRTGHQRKAPREPIPQTTPTSPSAHSLLSHATCVRRDVVVREPPAASPRRRAPPRPLLPTSTTLHLPPSSRPSSPTPPSGGRSWPGLCRLSVCRVSPVSSCLPASLFVSSQFHVVLYQLPAIATRRATGTPSTWKPPQALPLGHHPKQPPPGLAWSPRWCIPLVSSSSSSPSLVLPRPPSPPSPFLSLPWRLLTT
jgi:hypothetical protein